MKVKMFVREGRTTLQGYADNRRDQTCYATVSLDGNIEEFSKEAVQAAVNTLFERASAKYAKVHLPRGYTAIKEEK